MRRRLPPDGTTLIEAVVFSLIALAVVIALFVVYRDANRELAKTGVHLRGLQAAHALFERLRVDLRAAAAFDDPRGFVGLRVLDEASLELHRHAADPTQAQALPPDGPGGVSRVKYLQVRWTWDRKSGRVTRQEPGGRPEPISHLPYRWVSFTRQGDLLEVTLEWVPEEVANRPAAEQGEVLVARMQFGLEAEARALQHPGRIVNPTSAYDIIPIGATSPGGTIR